MELLLWLSFLFLSLHSFKNVLHYITYALYQAFLVAQMVKNLPKMQETQGPSLGWNYPLEKECLATPVFLPGKFHGQRSLAAYCRWGHKELDTIE